MKLNKHFKDLTLNQYIKIVDLETNEQPTEERAYKKLAIAYNSSVDVIKQQPKHALNTALARLNKPTTLPFNKYLLVDSNLLKATTTLNEMKTAQLVDFYNLYQKGAKYNELLAVMYVPFKGGYKPEIHYKVAKKLLDKRIDKVLGLLFLDRLFQQMREDYHNIFGETNDNYKSDDSGDTERQRVSAFLTNWGWEYNVDLCSENERVTHEEVYFKWNVIRFLNKLSYLIDKGKFEKALNGIK